MARTWKTTADITHRMSLQARRDTRPEMAIRSALQAGGRRFRVSYPVPELQRCSIDVAFPRRRVAVFVDGCFWHCCPQHGTRPQSNADRWAAKLDGNRERDRRVDAHLRDRGWTILRIWEHEDVGAACARVVSCLNEVEAAVGV
jgi:DNA mismatch endonuclease (patch repair protein)